MEGVLPEALVLLLAVVTAAWATTHRLILHRHRRSQVENVHVEPRKSVRVLKSREELEDAVRRAATFERGTAAVLELRARRYEAMLKRPMEMLDLVTVAVEPPGEPTARRALSA